MEVIGTLSRSLCLRDGGIHGGISGNICLFIKPLSMSDLSVFS
jgi:hypothetical protein